MNENGVVRTSMPRWIFPVLMISVVIVLFQALFALTVSDAGVISLSKSAAKAERDSKGGSGFFQGRSNEEIDQLITDRRADVIRNFRRQSWKPIAVKVMLAILFATIAFGVRDRKPKPARLIALIAGILLAFSIIVTLFGFGKILANIKYADSIWIILIDIVWYVFVVLTTAACFVAFVRLGALIAPPAKGGDVATPVPPAS